MKNKRNEKKKLSQFLDFKCFHPSNGFCHKQGFLWGVEVDGLLRAREVFDWRSEGGGEN